MQTIRDEPSATERVGAFEMLVEVAEPTAASERSWEQRVDALAAWLLAEWQRERKEAA
ncbi:MAG: hypothetical protein CHACPFDD_02281 [Phycisphaerae bacterium]|nr:hypothetical protein [Phycisphaerae bacterium]